MSSRDLADYVAIAAVVGLLLVLTTGCADSFVAHVNSDCRLLDNVVVSRSNDGSCVVCYHKGTAVAACIVTGQDEPPSEPPAPCLNCTPHDEETP